MKEQVFRAASRARFGWRSPFVRAAAAGLALAGASCVDNGSGRENHESTPTILPVGRLPKGEGQHFLSDPFTPAEPAKIVGGWLNEQGIEIGQLTLAFERGEGRVIAPADGFVCHSWNHLGGGINAENTVFMSITGTKIGTVNILFTNIKWEEPMPECDNWSSQPYKRGQVIGHTQVFGMITMRLNSGFDPFDKNAKASAYNDGSPCGPKAIMASCATR